MIENLKEQLKINISESELNVTSDQKEGIFRLYIIFSYHLLSVKQVFNKGLEINCKDKDISSHIKICQYIPYILNPKNPNYDAENVNKNQIDYRDKVYIQTNENQYLSVKYEKNLKVNFIFNLLIILINDYYLLLLFIIIIIIYYYYYYLLLLFIYIY